MAQGRAGGEATGDRTFVCRVAGGLSSARAPVLDLRLAGAKVGRPSKRTEAGGMGDCPMPSCDGEDLASNLVKEISVAVCGCANH